MAQRSVNLAISSRGLAALYAVEPKLMERIMENALPMRGRLLHTSDGKTESQLYDRNGQVLAFLVWHYPRAQRILNILRPEVYQLH